MGLMNKNIKLKQNRIITLLVGVFFVTYIVLIGIGAKDYGCCVDEAKQRNHALVVYKFLNQKLLKRTIDGLQNVPDLKEYGSAGLYGVVLQLPLVFIEDIF